MAKESLQYRSINSFNSIKRQQQNLMLFTNQKILILRSWPIFILRPSRIKIISFSNCSLPTLQINATNILVSFLFIQRLCTFICRYPGVSLSRQVVCFARRRGSVPTKCMPRVNTWCAWLFDCLTFPEQRGAVLNRIYLPAKAQVLSFLKCCLSRVRYHTSRFQP